jgi:hypothetical protein
MVIDRVVLLNTKLNILPVSVCLATDIFVSRLVLLRILYYLPYPM